MGVSIADSLYNGSQPHVVVLMGGSSSERPISLSTGKQIMDALDTKKYRVSGVDTADLLKLISGEVTQPAKFSSGNELPTNIGDNMGLAAVSVPAAGVALASAEGPTKADIVFIALHGKGGEDGTVQGLLEFLGIPYTGSGVLASALAMNKSLSKKLFAEAGIPVIDGILVTRKQAECDGLGATLALVRDRLGFPVFVKPNSEGSTFGCTLVGINPAEIDTMQALERAILTGLEFDSSVIIERYTAGIEITVGVLENLQGIPEALPVVEIVPKSIFYDYESKYADGGSEHIIPARLSAEQTQTAQSQALACHALLGCSGMSRTDMILSDGVLYVLEVNTIPGMTPTSLLPQAAASSGISFPDMLDRILCAAVRRFREGDHS